MRTVVELARRVAPRRIQRAADRRRPAPQELFAGLITRRRRAQRTAREGELRCAARNAPRVELFGHERGAFTGADRGGSVASKRRAAARCSSAKSGRCRRRSRPSSCACSRTRFHRVGGTQTLRTDARLVAATNVELEGSAPRRIPRRPLFPPRRDSGSSCRRFASDRDVVRARAPLPERVRGRARRSARVRARRDGAPARATDGRGKTFGTAQLRSSARSSLPRVRGSARRPGPDRRRIDSPIPDAWRPRAAPAGWSLRDWERALVEEALQRAGYVQRKPASYSASAGAS